MNVNTLKKDIIKDFTDHPVECSTSRKFYWKGYIAALLDASQINEEQYGDLRHYISKAYVKTLGYWQQL